MSLGFSELQHNTNVIKLLSIICMALRGIQKCNFIKSHYKVLITSSVLLTTAIYKCLQEFTAFLPYFTEVILARMWLNANVSSVMWTY